MATFHDRRFYLRLVCQNRKMKTKPLSFSLTQIYRQHNLDHFSFAFNWVFTFFFGIIFQPCFSLWEICFFFFFFTLFDADDNNYLIAKYLLELHSVTIFLFTFPLFYLIYTWEAFPFICEVNWKKGHWTRFMIFLSSTEIFTLYSMKLLLELLFFFSSLFAVLEIHRLVVLNFSLNYLPYRYKHCSIITLKRWWRFTRKLTNIYAFYIYEITN